MANGPDRINGVALQWAFRAALIAFVGWAIADRIAVSETLIDLRERIVALETRHNIERGMP